MERASRRTRDPGGRGVEQTRHRSGRRPAALVAFASCLVAIWASADDIVPPAASALVAPTQAGWTERAEPTQAIAVDPRGEMIRDALLLDFAGYHEGAGQVVHLLRNRHPDDTLVALIEVEHLFWPQLYDVGPVRDDPRLVDAIARAVALAEADYKARPDDARARAYYGRALLHDARRLALDGYLMKAGARGENARGLLESVLEVEPDDDDTRYLLANYYYWAGVLPAYLKYVNWLWFVPRGDKQDGLAMLREVGRGEGPYAASANVMLSVVGTHHAPTSFDDAHARLFQLHERYPRNVLIHHELVDLLFKMERYEELEAQLDDMATRANDPQPFRAYGLVAELWRARIALHQRHVDEAERRLDALAERGDDLPNWTASWIDVIRGQIFDLRGRRAEAKRAYERAIERKGIEESQRAQRMASAGMKAPFDPDRFEHPLLPTGE